MKPVIMLYTGHVYLTRGDLYKNEGDPKGLSIIRVDKRRRGVGVTVVEPVNVLLNWPPRGDFERAPRGPWFRSRGFQWSWESGPVC